MKKEEYLKELKKFDDFKFFEEDHHYEYKEKRVGISVTRFIEDYCQPFERDAIAEKCANKQKCSVSEILKQWQVKNDNACLKGHLGHVFAQNLWEGINYQENEESVGNDLKMALDKVKAQAKQFYDDYKDRLEHLSAEFVIGSHEYDIASAIDHLFINKATGELVLADYKTNSILGGFNDDGKKSKYAKNMKVPLQNLKDITINHYYIQLSIYRYLLEKYTNLKVSEMFIVYFSENIDNYEIIDVPYLKEEVEKILESRIEKKMGKCIPVLIIGHSGSGKSTSLRNLKKEEYSLVNPLAKRLPFKGGNAGLESTNYDQIKNFISKTPKDIIVIDDSNYLMTVEMMDKVTATGYSKFTEMAQDYWDLINFIKNLDGDKRVYLMSHEEVEDNGFIGVKTVGKMLSNQCCVEGLYTIVLRAESEKGKFRFRTHTLGNDIVKSPIGMFEEDTIDNDLAIVDKAICEYYEINEQKKDEENE